MTFFSRRGYLQRMEGGPFVNADPARQGQGADPLLDSLPDFPALAVAEIGPTLDGLLAENRALLADLLTRPEPPTFATVIWPLEEMEDRVNRFWSPVRHLHSVADTEALRAAYRACLVKLSDYATEMAQNEGLYAAYQHIWDGRKQAGLSRFECRTLELALRDFRLSGVTLPPAARERFKALRQELAQLQTRFEEQVLDATQGWVKHVLDETALEGLPAGAIALAQAAALQQGQEGWVFTLELPSYLPVMTHARSSELRLEVYRAFVTRASDQGPNAGRWDNTAVMEGILSQRQGLARVAGFANYAEYSLATKMAKGPDDVLRFLRDLTARAKAMAIAELAELNEFAGCSVSGPDLYYWSERLKREKYAVSEEDLRPYFPLPKVLQGMFELTRRLFGITIQERTGIPAWHCAVRFFVVYDAKFAVRGGFYVDLYARGHKRGGAWMDECLVRHGTECGVRLPVAYLTCNLTSPIGSTPALLTHNEVLTLLHEFGHTLHHLLTQVDRPSIAGINGVAWDAVELPSQFLENWGWAAEGLALLSGHHETGDTIGPDLLHRMLAARNFQSGMQMLRQIEFALLDMRLHMEYAPGMKIQEVVNEVREEVSVLAVPPYNRFQNSFSHIFAGGYAAGYYSYKWAEVLAADAFAKFEEQGIMDRGTGDAFLHEILEAGGSADPLELFRAFRGREPSIDPLLRQSGILPRTTTGEA